MIYLDSSAIVKLVVREPESEALRGFLRRHSDRASCGLARVEVPRAVAPHGGDATARARLVFAGMHLIHLDECLLDTAGALEAIGLRSLDAIHLVAARELGEDLECVVTYDRRMTTAALAIGLPAARPA